MFGMPDIIVPWFLPRPEEPAHKTLPQGGGVKRNSLGMGIAQSYHFLHHLRTRTKPRKISIGLQSVFDDSRINFRKAGANYSPLQQNHPNRSFSCRSNPLEKTTRIQFKSFASKHR
jgi:hypothetical protein